MFKATFLDSSDFSARLVGSGGIVPSGTITITQNGIVDVGEYANASVIVLDSYKYAQELGAIW